MHFRDMVILLISLSLVAGCSTDPEVNTEVLRDKTMVMCKLGIGSSTPWQQLYIQRIRYLVDIAFTEEEEVPFGIEGADVVISGGGHEMTFADNGNGIYRYTYDDSTGRITTGEQYDLHINLPDGEYISSSIITPEMTFPVEKDTLFIRPDSVVDYWYEYGSPYPLTFEGPRFLDTLYFDLGESTVLRDPATSSNIDRPNDLFWITGLDRELYQYPQVYENYLTFSTAVDSPMVFMNGLSNDSTQIHFQIRHTLSQDYADIMHDDLWPLDEEYLKQVSNINNAYGVFTTGPYSFSKPFVVSVAP